MLFLSLKVSVGGCLLPSYYTNISRGAKSAPTSRNCRHLSLMLSWSATILHCSNLMRVATEVTRPGLSGTQSDNLLTIAGELKTVSIARTINVSKAVKRNLSRHFRLAISVSRTKLLTTSSSCTHTTCNASWTSKSLLAKCATRALSVCGGRS